MKTISAQDGLGPALKEQPRVSQKTARGRWLVYTLAILGGLVLVSWPLLLNDIFFTHVATLVLLYCIGAAGLHLILRTGHVSMGHAAFMGIGAYTSVVTMMKLAWPYPLALATGALLAALLALALGPIILRVRGVYFVLVTFTLGEVVRLVFVNWVPVTGGSNGIFQVPPPFPLFLSNLAYYYLALVMAALCVGLVGRIVTSEVGRVLDAIGESERLAQSTGVPVLRFKVLAFVIGCTLVGIQGSLQAHFIRYISPVSFAFSESLNFVVMNVVGGMNSLVGAMIGALFIVPLPEFLRGWVEYQHIFYGIILILVMAFMPSGLAGLLSRAAAALSMRRRGDDA